LQNHETFLKQIQNKAIKLFSALGLLSHVLLISYWH